MQCVCHVDLSQIDVDEIEKMIRVLSDTRSIGVGSTEHILSMAVFVLTKILVSTDENDAHEVFREKQGELAVAEVLYVVGEKHSIRAGRELAIRVCLLV